MSQDRPRIDISASVAREALPAGVVLLSPLDARVLRAVEPMRERTVVRIARLAGCPHDLAASSLRRLRRRMLIEPDGSRPTGWLRTRRGDLFLEHQP
jgi:hypothetical protein